MSSALPFVDPPARWATGLFLCAFAGHFAQPITETALWRPKPAPR